MRNKITFHKTNRHLVTSFRLCWVSFIVQKVLEWIRFFLRLDNITLNGMLQTNVIRFWAWPYKHTNETLSSCSKLINQRLLYPLHGSSNINNKHIKVKAKLSLHILLESDWLFHFTSWFRDGLRSASYF